MIADIVAAGQSPGSKDSNNSNQGKSKKRLENEQKTSTEPDKTKRFSLLTVNKMINRFLTRNRIKRTHKKEESCLKYTEEELAQKLGIKPKDLKRLKLPYFCKSRGGKIVFSLIRLYCATKWKDEEYKGK
ncbi:MAG: hypothetical protein ACD_21C00267G0006 [uncultured bacterium]|nr:MAG: hypothetical protein ACD_21C00267G0006 [uncultured bacterium]